MNTLDIIEVALGVSFAVILSMVFGVFIGILGSYAGLLLATGVTSYYFIYNIKNAALYGALVGVISGLVSTIIMILFEFVLGGKMDLSFMSFGYGGILVGIMVDGIICSTGSTIGSILNH